jgi:hypothetical protein
VLEREVSWARETGLSFTRFAVLVLAISWIGVLASLFSLPLLGLWPCLVLTLLLAGTIMICVHLLDMAESLGIDRKSLIRETQTFAVKKLLLIGPRPFSAKLLRELIRDPNRILRRGETTEELEARRRISLTAISRYGSYVRIVGMLSSVTEATLSKYTHYREEKNKARKEQDT